MSDKRCVRCNRPSAIPGVPDQSDVCWVGYPGTDAETFLRRLHCCEQALTAEQGTSSALRLARNEARARYDDLSDEFDVLHSRCVTAEAEVARLKKKADDALVADKESK